MQKFTDIFIKRPVLASVISLLIFILGLKSIFTLQLREFPKMENTVITITTAYPGASAEVIQGFITTIIEKAIAGAEGIDYITANSIDGVSTIKAYIKLNFDPYQAFTDIMSKTSEVTNQLPKESNQPVIEKDTGSQFALMYIAFNSADMSSEQITDYLTRVVQPKLETISGVASAQILGGNIFAMRIWLNPDKMAALNLSPTDIVAALQANNFQSAAGSTKGEYVAYSINAATDVHDQQAFENLVVRNVGNTLIRLKDVAQVKIGSQTYDSSVTFNGQKAVFIGVTSTPTANPLTVISDVRKVMPILQKSFPPSLQGNIVYDATEYIRSSIHEVIKTIVEATIIVIIVIFLFLGAIRSVLIPVVTIPLSLIGVCTLMLALGYSINILTLLAMVLAIGLVVDDAIVVVENIHRHIEEGMPPFQAAIQGAREIATPVISMTITLAAVYAPIGFMSGLTGSLFKEFAFTLACTVIISGIVALTLSPMLCAKLLNAEISQHRFVHFIDSTFEKIKTAYLKRLHNTLNYRSVVLVLAVCLFISCFFLFYYSNHELAPEEDQSVLFMSATSPQYANIDYLSHFTTQLDKIFQGIPEVKDYFVVNGVPSVNNAFAGAILKPWGDRTRSQQQLQPILQNKVNQIAGLQTWVIGLPSLPISGDGPPVQFVITSIGSYKELYQVAEQLQLNALKSGLFIFIDSDLKFNKPQLNIQIDRNKAAELGINMNDIGNALAASLGGNYINLFSMQGKSYQVIPQLERSYRLNPQQLNTIYVKSLSGAMIPLSTVISIKPTIAPNQLNEYQQLHAVTLNGMMMPGHSIGESLLYLQDQAEKILPKGMTYNYAGESLQYIREGNALMYTFFFAIVIIFLVLAAQFESFRDPFIILLGSVPMSVFGALLFLNLGLASINIYTEVGLLTLIGLISKHGILMVDFANKLQEHEGFSAREAIEKAASIRLRPILMTTAAMVLGVAPLILSSGAGAKSRFDIGLVIAAGMLIGTILALFVVPTLYTYLARKRA